MITRAKIDAASSTLTETAVLSLISIVRMTDRYKSNPSYFSDIKEKIEATGGTTKAKQLNAALDELEKLGIGEVEINQAQTVGTDGLVYSKGRERASLIEYALGVLYEAFSSSVYPSDDESILMLKGEYGAGRLPLDYPGCF